MNFFAGLGLQEILFLGLGIIAVVFIIKKLFKLAITIAVIIALMILVQKPIFHLKGCRVYHVFIRKGP